MTKNLFYNSARVFLIAAFCFVLSISGVFGQAQAGTGQIAGLVADSNGAVVPNATVTLTSKATNATQTTTSNEDGFYKFILLQPGTYDVKAASGSFAPQSLAVEVQVGRITDANFTLGATGVAAEVTVTAEGVQSTTSNFDAVQSETAIQNLPINGRRFQDFVTLTPTAQVDPSRGQISLSGQRGINSNVNVDGVDYNQPFFGGVRGGERSNSAFTLPQESIREFQVVAAGYSAEFGRSSGGIVNAVTKSGSNDFKGTAFYLLRPKQLARANDFAKAIKEQRLGPLGLDATLAPTQHQFGGSVGGPIVKEKFFYFASAEFQRFRAPRQVLFGNIANVAPASLDAEDLAVFNFYRALEVPFEQTNDAIAALGKIDWNINDSNRFNVRYNISNNKAINAVSTGETALDPTTTNSLSTNGTEKNRNHIVVAQFISNLSSNIINEGRFQFAHERRPRIGNSQVANINTAIGVYGTRNFLPTTQFDRRLQFADALTYIAGNHTFKFGGEFSNIYAEQSFGFNQFGVYAPGTNNVTGNGGILDVISTNPTGTPLGRFDVANATYTQQIGNLQAGYTVRELSFFGQDSWRISPNLTVNYGLRYEKQFNPTAETNNAAVLNAVRSTNFPIVGGTIDPSTIPDSDHQLGPRLGFAWDPKADGKTVVRGYTGLYYARTPLLVLAGPFNNFRDPAGDLSVVLGSRAFVSTTASPFNQATFDAANPQYVAIVGANQAPNTVYRQFAILGINLNSSSLTSLPTLTPAQLTTIGTAIRNATTNPPVNLGVFQNAAFTGITPDFDNPRSFQFGGGVEREVMSGMTVGVDYSQVNTVYLQRNRDINVPGPLTADQYVAFLQANNSVANFNALSTATNNFAAIRSTGRQLIGIVAPNSIPTNISGAVVTRPRPLSSIGSLQLRDSSGRSLYRALTFRVNWNNKLMRLNAFYTLSKSTSDDDNERDAGGVLYDNPYDLRSEYYLSRLDRRHQFVANPIVFLPWGFEVASAIRLRAGVPFNSQVGADLNGDGLLNDRPFITPTIELQRNYFYNRPVFDVDLRVQKGIKFDESRKVTFTAEFFNVLNRSNIQLTQFAVTNYCAGAAQSPTCGLNGIANSSFAQILNQTGTFAGKINVANNPGSQVFQMQVGVRFQF